MRAEEDVDHRLTSLQADPVIGGFTVAAARMGSGERCDGLPARLVLHDVMVRVIDLREEPVNSPVSV